MSNLPTKFEPQQQMSLYPTTSEWGMLKEQAVMLIKSKFLPSAIQTPEQAIAIMLKGRELNMPPMQSFAHIAIIQGKPTMSAECMLAQIFKTYPTTKLKYVQNDDEACIIEVTKPGNVPSTFQFTYEDAKKAKLTNKDNWDKYRRAMLRSRCVSEMARSMFPESLMGISYIPEELEPIPEEKADDKPKEEVVVEVPKSPEVKAPIIFDINNKEHTLKILNKYKEDQSLIPDGMYDKLLEYMHGKEFTMNTLSKGIAHLSVPMMG